MNTNCLRGGTNLKPGSSLPLQTLPGEVLRCNPTVGTLLVVEGNECLGPKDRICAAHHKNPLTPTGGHCSDPLALYSSKSYHLGVAAPKSKGWSPFLEKIYKRKLNGANCSPIAAAGFRTVADPNNPLPNYLFHITLA